MSRLILRSLRPLPSPSLRLTTPRAFSSTFDPAPSPPRLPASQQAEFERLQREAEARLSTHTTATATPNVSPLATSRHTTSPASSQPQPPSPDHPPPAAQGVAEVTLASPAAEGQAAGGGGFSGGIRKGAPPEFEGETNPRTGEVGGPKNEPLRWGGAGDWSYNGRVTDF